jgi:Site-specific recombinase XerD
MRTGENIYKRKDGRWEARFIYEYDANGKAKYRSVYGISRQKAKQKRQELINKYVSSIEISTAPLIIFEELARNWLNSTRLRVKESTYARYCNQVQKYILPHFGKYQALKISTEFIEQFISRLLKMKTEGGFGLSSKTVEDILIIIKSIFKFGKCSSHLELNRIKIKKEDKRSVTLSNADKILLNEYLLRDIDEIKVGILLSVHLGIRIGELCALRWKAFDLEAESVHVEKTMQRIQMLPEEVIFSGKKTKVMITAPKSKSSIRDLALPSFLTAILRKMKSNPDNFFLTGNVQGMEPRSLHNHFKKILKQCGAPDYNYHSLRHTFATSYIAAGYDVKSLSEILGHSNVKITLERYVHISGELKRKNIENLARVFFTYSPSELPSTLYAESS